MNLIQHTIDWAKGEIVEAIIMAIFGGIIVLCSVLLWKYGSTPFGKGLIIPLLIVGIIPLFSGISGAITTKNRIEQYQVSWEKNPKAFIQSEKERVEGFDEIFKYTYPMAIILTIGGAILFFVLGSPTWKGISLAMMTMGLMTYYIDHFAKERADMYMEHIERALK